MQEIQLVEKAIAIIPEKEKSLISDLKLSLEKENVRSCALDILQKYMFVPSQDWQYEIISMISGCELEGLKEVFELAKTNSEKMNEKLKNLR